MDEHKEKLFTLQTALLIVGGIAVNMLGSLIVTRLKLSLYMDSLGTIITSALAGWLPGILVGFFSNVLISLRDNITLYYGILNVFIAIMAAYFARQGIFRRLIPTLGSALAFAFIGGILGSLMTWMLYGLHIGEGISASYAIWLNSHTTLGAFISQLLADGVIDVADKVLTVIIAFFVLKLYSKKSLASLPLGYVYKSGETSDVSKVLAAEQKGKYYRTVSLSDRVSRLIIATAGIISVLALFLCYRTFSNTAYNRFVEIGTMAARLAAKEINGDDIGSYLKTRTITPGYTLAKERLMDIQRAIPSVKYLYVYHIEPAGCRVVFDLDSTDVPGRKLGEVEPFEQDFMSQYGSDLLAGREIKPIVTDDKYGWLLTIYCPIRDSSGNCAAYAGVDINMGNVVADRSIFFIRLLSLLFGFSILIISFAIWFAENNLVMPINKLAAATSDFAYDTQQNRKVSTARVKQLMIKTGDEIENLYDAISRTTSDVSNFLNVIDKQNAEMLQKAAIITKMQDKIIVSFADMVENRDETTGCHIKRTAAYVKAIGDALYERGIYSDILTPEYRRKLYKSAPLHDVGKIRISDAILSKPGKLTPSEFSVIKTHTTAGGEILEEVLSGIESDNYLSEAINMAMYHHEWWNGNGYPKQLQGEAIPLSARIMAVADVFDALTSKRSYKSPFSFDKAMAIIKSEAGTHFDPAVADTFIAISDQIKNLMEETPAH